MIKKLFLLLLAALPTAAAAQVIPAPSYVEPFTGTPVTVAPVSLAANAITLISPPAANRIGFSVQIETATTAPVYLCSNGQSSTCSATVHDAMIPAGAGVGTEYYFGWPSTGGYYAISSAAVTIAAHSVTL